MAQVTLADPLSAVIGGKTAKALADGLGLRTVEDLLRHYPRRYLERGELTSLDALRIGDDVTVFAEVRSASSRELAPRGGGAGARGKRRTMEEIVISDGRGDLSVVFFSQPWRVGQCAPGRRGLFAGTVSAYGRKRQLTHPQVILVPSGHEEEVDAEAALLFTSDLIPVYRATSAIPSWRISQSITLALASLQPPEDPIPMEVLAPRGLMDFATALHDIHRGLTREAVDQAARRLRFDEAFGLQLVLAQRRHALSGEPAVPRPRRPDGLLAAFDERRPYELTGAQRRVGEEISADLSAAHPMHRLLQGDVGSGKTLVALRAMLEVVDAGGQAVLLAPTEVLAQQHYRTIIGLLGELAQQGMLGGAEVGTRVGLLTGSQGSKRRRSELLDLASGQAGIAVGTHALLEDNVTFADLGLIVVDEQHRFGVEQRAALATRGREGTRPHVLVMTATPIPRTVAMTVFGDLDVSTLDEYPPGRGAIATHVVAPREHPAHLARAWQRVREEVAAGRKVYVVAPRIGDGDVDEEELLGGLEDREIDEALSAEESVTTTESVLGTATQLAERILPDLRIGVLHGRMAPDEKDLAMARFALPVSDPESIDVLVSTTVIEVGVDVPIASTMIILDAERFGISQLHQLRGRVGRGGDDGLCLLVTGAEPGTPSRERLDAVAATTDGFVLARVDLHARREGDVLGTSQSGRHSSLRLLSVVRDADVVVDARDAATELVTTDPALQQWPKLRAIVDELIADDRSDYLEKA